jgi:hypothetical protein
MSKKLRVTKNGHYNDCLLSSVGLITDINIKCWCGRPLPTTLGCAVGRVLCGNCYTELCLDRGYNREFSLCLNRRLDRHINDPDERQQLDIDGVAEYINNVPESHFHQDLVNVRRAEIQKQKQIEKWREAEALALFWRNNDPGSYHDSEPDDSIVDNDSIAIDERDVIDLVSDQDDNVAPVDLPELEPELEPEVEVEPPRKRRRLMKKAK